MSDTLKNYAKRLISGSLGFSFSKKQRFVFLFHDISEPSEVQYSEQYSTPVNNFYQLVDSLNKKFELVDIDTVHSVDYKGKTGKPLATITFDDGFYSVYKRAYPYLLDMNIPFTLFINKQSIIENQIWFTNLVLNKNNNDYWEKFYNEVIDKSKVSLAKLKQLEIWEIFNCIKVDSLSNLHERIAIVQKNTGRYFAVLRI